MTAGAEVLLACAVAGGAGCGAGLGALLARSHAERRRRRELRRPSQGAASAGREGVLDYVEGLSTSLGLGATRPISGRVGRLASAKWLEGRAAKAGVEGAVTPAGLVEGSVRLGLGAAAVLGAVGLALSPALGALLAAVGLVWGVSAPARAITRRIAERSEALERSLPEMLEVVALGLRSGLSFDRSFELYAQHFSTELATSCAACQRRWSFGLATREAALRDLAASYDSALFERVVGGMVRSLRFGSSLADGLEQAAGEARAVHRARMEERVAKAPVKMMLPTAALILPAMLLLVLGPVLLDLMEGL